MFTDEAGRKILEQMAKLNFDFVKKMEELGFNVVIHKSSQMPRPQESEFVISEVGKNSLSREEEYSIIKAVAPEMGLINEVSEDEYFKKPFLPAVVKGEAHGGSYKFILETTEQQERFYNFLQQEGNLLSGDFFRYSKFIETPGDRYTSYRILVTATGKILASALFASEASKSQPQYIISTRHPEDLGRPGTNITEYLTNPTSPHYLQSKKFMSNIGRGGRLIPLNPTESTKPINEEDNVILSEHGIVNQQLPERLLAASQKIAKAIGKYKALVMGIDFIQDKEGNFHYLEANPGPGVDTYLAAKNQGEGTMVEGNRMMMEEVIDSIAND